MVSVRSLSSYVPCSWNRLPPRALGLLRQNKCFLQHNIKSNDIVTYRSLWSTRKAKVLKVGDNTMLVKAKRVDTGYEEAYVIFNITGVNDVKPVLNLYYKDENGNCYGKIDGKYNEIQL